jgi:hypothetical protein
MCYDTSHQEITDYQEGNGHQSCIKARSRDKEGHEACRKEGGGRD